MNAEGVIGEAQAVGVRLWHEAGRVRYQGPKAALTSMLPALVACRNEVAEVLRREAQSEAFEERAAIMEYDGGMTRANAEVAARLLLKLSEGTA